MSAPVVSVPQGGQVLSRPRKEGLFDSEKILAASTTQTLYTFFLSTRTFSDSNASGTKIFQYDTNLIGNGGSIPRGHYLRVFGVQLYLTRRDVQNLTAQALDDKRKIIDSSTWRLLLGSTPYMDVPTNKIPSGTGMTGAVATTENNLTIGEWQNAVANCFCIRMAA